MLRLSWTVFVFVPLAAAPALAQVPCPTFPARVYDAGPTPEAVEAADMDLDGDLDLVVADSCLPQVRVLWNDGAGAFETFTDLSTWDPVRAVLVGDLDGDGDADVVALESYTDAHVLVFTNQDGVLVLAQRLLVDANGARPDLGDLDGDGQPELVLCAYTNAQSAEHGFLVLPNQAGIFGAPVFHGVGGSTPMTDTELADFDGDDDLDVVGLVGGAMYFWLNNGAAGLVLSGADGYVGVTRMLAAKLDADDYADRVLVRYPTRDLVLLLTTEAVPITLATFTDFPSEVRAADLDGDGRIDLRVAADTLRDYFQLPGGGFAPAGTHAAAASSARFASADLDGDGTLDIAAVSPLVDALSVVLASGESYAPAQRLSAGDAVDQDFADIDGDGDLDVVRAHPTGSRVYLRSGGVLAPIGSVLPGARHARFADLIAGGPPEVVLYSATSPLITVCAAANGLDYAALPETFGTGVSPNTIVAGDLDQDGRLDLVVGNAAQTGPLGPIGIYRGHGDGTFDAPSIYYAINDPIAIALVDVDGDTDLDVVASVDSPFAGPILVLRNTGGLLGGPELVANETAAGARFAAGDVDGDGDADLVAAASNLRELRVYANDGTGAFTRAHTLPLAREVLGMQLARIDGDGALDVVTVETSSPMHAPGQLVVERRNDGTGSFAITAHHAMSELGDRPFVGDSTGDGDVDVLLLDATSPNQDGVWVLENSGACSTGDALCAGDGSATACPCGNGGANGRGCANSFDPNGAALSANGTALVAHDTLTLTVSGLPPTTLVHFLQSDTAENGGAGVVFGDGLLCVGGTLRRLAVRQASAGVAELGAGALPAVSLAQLGALPPQGGTRIYQARYRNVANFCTSATFNTSNAWRVVWGD
ncbi:MAG: VCBS repeat-containing protein [Planctomycetes bacterium]|nr:VCBS repeat-containing protein [Planctomycetota bacterium]